MKSSYIQQLSPDHPLASEAFDKALETLKRFNEERTAARSLENDESAKLTQALYQPLLKQISENPEASLALEHLRHSRVHDTADFVKDLPVRDDQSSSTFLNLQLHEHLSFANAPYDFDWNWGNSFDSLHNKAEGNIGIRGASGHVQHGTSARVEAAAGIGLIVTTDKPASVQVRPFITYTWESLVVADGLFSSGEARGGIDAAAFLNGAIIKTSGVRRSELFSSRSSSGTDRRSDGGIVWVPEVTLKFDIEPGQVVAVTFGAWIECDHTSGIGYGGGAGIVQAKVSWVVVDRLVAG